MKQDLTLELEYVFGGDGFVREEPKEKIGLKRTRTRTTTKTSIGIPIPEATEEEQKEMKMEPIHTFRMENGVPMLRLGGSHGKLWGALKEAARQLYNLGDRDFAKGYTAIVDMVLVNPSWVKLETDGEPMHVEGIPQEMKGLGGGMIIQYFDVIPKATVHVQLVYPDALEKKVRKLLEQVQFGTHLNKRRTTIKILNM